MSNKKNHVTSRKEFKPWFTKGLKNACKKKNNLYTKFLQYNNPKSLEKYKRYKNKLTKILRSCEKMYYDKILEQQKKNVKGTWNILNKIIGKKEK